MADEPQAIEDDTGAQPLLRQLFADNADTAEDLAEDHAEASRRVAAAQDDLAAAGRQRDKEREDHPGVVRSHETHSHSEEFNGEASTGRGTRCCAGVYDCGTEASLYLRAKTPPTQKQLLHLLLLAQKKGWDEIYVFNSKGQPNLGLAMQLDQLATAAMLKPYGRTALEKRICKEMQGLTICKTPAQYQAASEQNADPAAKITGEKADKAADAGDKVVAAAARPVLAPAIVSPPAA